MFLFWFFQKWPFSKNPKNNFFPCVSSRKANVTRPPPTTEQWLPLPGSSLWLWALHWSRTKNTGETSCVLTENIYMKWVEYYIIQILNIRIFLYLIKSHCFLRKRKDPDWPREKTSGSPALIFWAPSNGCPQPMGFVHAGSSQWQPSHTGALLCSCCQPSPGCQLKPRAAPPLCITK